jgi:hypothetical protein
LGSVNTAADGRHLDQVGLWDAEEGIIGRDHSPFMPHNGEGTVKAGGFSG